MIELCCEYYLYGAFDCVFLSCHVHFSFCSDFNLEATVVKTDEIRGLKQLLTPCFLLIGKKIFSQNNS